MGNACCQDVHDGTSLMISDLPQKTEYFQSQWPGEDTYIQNFLDKANDKMKNRQPFKHRDRLIFYAGDWEGDLPHGKGVIYIPGKLLYEGNFKDGKPEGLGTVELLNLKCSYEGYISQGKANGKGRFVNSQDQYTFTGQWEHSMPKTGRLDFFNSKTVIEFQDYEKNHARISYEDSKVYHGQIDLKTFMPEGVGEVIFPDGSKYNGEFLGGKMHGKGVFQWRNSKPGKYDEKYDGDYQYGKKHGYGKFIFSSGNIYDGQWVNGKRQGQGILVDQNGAQISKGIWYNGQLMNDKQDNHQQIVHHDVPGLKLEGAVENNVHSQVKYAENHVQNQLNGIELNSGMKKVESQKQVEIPMQISKSQQPDNKQIDSQRPANQEQAREYPPNHNPPYTSNQANHEASPQTKHLSPNNYLNSNQNNYNQDEIHSQTKPLNLPDDKIQPHKDEVYHALNDPLQHANQQPNGSHVVEASMT